MDNLERLVASDSIRQLASRYALALDSRDLDALVGLFVIAWGLSLPAYREIAALGIPFLALAFLSARLARNVASPPAQDAVAKKSARRANSA